MEPRNGSLSLSLSLSLPLGWNSIGYFSYFSATASSSSVMSAHNLEARNIKNTIKSP